MSKEKQIEEMAEIIGIPCYKRINEYGDGSQECPSPLPCNECTAELLYKAGYRKQEWISVEERLPEDQQMVLTIDTEGEMGVCFYETEREGIFQMYHGLVEIYNITHWMPLPEPPKGE